MPYYTDPLIKKTKEIQKMEEKFGNFLHDDFHAIKRPIELRLRKDKVYIGHPMFK